MVEKKKGIRKKKKISLAKKIVERIKDVALLRKVTITIGDLSDEYRTGLTDKEIKKQLDKAFLKQTQNASRYEYWIKKVDK